MSSYQSITIVGNLGKEPEMRFTPSGQPVTSFSVATNRAWTDNAGTKHDETTWFRVSAWGKQAENCNQYLHKGNKVLIEGRLNADASGNPRIWNRQDGTPATNFEVTANTVRFLSSRGESDSEEAHEEIGSEEIPF